MLTLEKLRHDQPRHWRKWQDHAHRSRSHRKLQPQSAIPLQRKTYLQTQVKDSSCQYPADEPSPQRPHFCSAGESVRIHQKCLLQQFLRITDHCSQCPRQCCSQKVCGSKVCLEQSASVLVRDIGSERPYPGDRTLQDRELWESE